MRFTFGLAIAAAIALFNHSVPLVAAADPPKAGTVAPIASLSFLEGTWTGTCDGERFECSYSSPAGGKMVSWSKAFHGDKVAFFELEVFEEKNGTVVVTPHPDGRRAASFKLASLEGEKATFTNPKNDFPSKIVYERVSKDELRFEVSGTQGGQSAAMKFALSRRDATARDARPASR
ncbi:MAG: DUF6265 family protein [Planctomycetota bacterium]